jgi:hypothetical protein
MAFPSDDGSSPLAPAASFFVRLVVVYALLAAPWPGLARAYATVYSAAATALVGDFGRGEARFRPAADGNAAHDVEIGLRRQGDERDAAWAPHNARVLGYLPSAELAALVLASPVPWRRRLRALAMGMAVLHAFLGLRLGIMLAAWFSQDSPWQTLDPGDATAAFLARANEALVVSATPSFLAPIVVWIPVTFRREDLTAFVRRFGAADQHE